MVLISISASNINLHDDVYVDWQWVVSRDFLDKVKFMFSFEEIILNYVTFVDIFLIFFRFEVGGGSSKMYCCEPWKESLKFVLISACCHMLLPSHLRIPCRSRHRDPLKLWYSVYLPKYKIAVHVTPPFTISNFQKNTLHLY